MLNSSTHSNAQRYALNSRAVEFEEKLPITDDARNGLSSLAIGLIGSLIVAVALLLVRVLAM